MMGIGSIAAAARARRRRIAAVAGWLTIVWLGMLLLHPAVYAQNGSAPAADNEVLLDKVSLALPNAAGPEYGGFFQAVADGTYAAYGLDVQIVPGGPGINNRTQVANGKLDFYVLTSALQSLDAAQQSAAVITIAAFFQKATDSLFTHPDPKLARLDDLKELSILASKEGLSSLVKWLRMAHGFSEDKARLFAGDAQAFISDRRAALQGSAFIEPFVIEKQHSIRPITWLMADHGWDDYGMLIETRPDLIDARPGLVQRFIDASIIGWYRFLYGESGTGITAIRALNPAITEDYAAFVIRAMKEFGIVDSGDTLKFGIGAISDARMAAFFSKMVRIGRLKSITDYRSAYSQQFVNKSVGLELRPRQ